MSVIAAMHCWDVLLTAAAACSVQLLHDANDSVFIAVGYTLHSFCELERILLSLWTGFMSCHATDKPQLETSTVSLPAANIVSSSSSAAAAAVNPAAVSQMSLVNSDVQCDDLPASVQPDSSAAAAAAAVNPAAVSQMSLVNSDVQCDDLPASVQPDSSAADVDGQLTTSVQVSAHCDAVNVDSQLNTGSQHVTAAAAAAETALVCRQFSRSGRPVNSKNFADFISSEMTVKDSPQSCLPVNKTSLKQRRGRPCKPPINSCSTDATEACVINQQQDMAKTGSSQQRVDGPREQQADKTAAQDCVSDTPVEHGTVHFL